MKTNTIRERAKRLLKFYGSIPEEKWITDTSHDGKGNCCAVGFVIDAEDKHLMKDFDELRYGSHIDLAGVNNKGTIKYHKSYSVVPKKEIAYKQETPKTRVIACLEDIIRGQYDGRE